MKRFFFTLIIFMNGEIFAQPGPLLLPHDIFSSGVSHDVTMGLNLGFTLAGPPVKVAGLGGYHSAVPVAWTPDTTDTLLGYHIYKSSSSTGPFSQIGYTLIKPYYRDTDVSNGTRYYYKIKTVYRHSESDFSVMKNGLPEENGFILRPTWASTTPTIDGVISTGEWPKYNAIDISFPTPSGNVLLYAMNDQNTLFLAIDDQKNTQLDDWDGMGMYFDRDLDREWSNDPGVEGLLQFHWEASTSSVKSRFLALHGRWPDSFWQEFDDVLAGMKQGISFSSGHVQFEMSISLTEGPLKYHPFGSLGYLIYTYNGGNNTLTGFLPQEVEAELPKFAGWMNWSMAPFAFGDLILAQTTPSNFYADVDRNGRVDIFDIQLVAASWGSRQGDANYKAEYDITGDGRIDIFDIQSVAAWWNKPIPAMKRLKDLEMASGETVQIAICKKAPRVYEVWAADAVDLAAFEMEFSAPNGNLLQVIMGDFLNQTDNTVVALPPYYADDGNVSIGAFSYGANTGASGKGKLAELLFQKDTNLVLKDIKCADHCGNAIAVRVDEMDHPSSAAETGHFELAQNYPNPFNPSTTIRYDLPEAAIVKIHIYNQLGQNIKTFDQGWQKAGSYQVIWNGASDQGATMPSGAYYYKIFANDFQDKRIMTLVK